MGGLQRVSGAACSSADREAVETDVNLFAEDLALTLAADYCLHVGAGFWNGIAIRCDRARTPARRCAAWCRKDPLPRGLPTGTAMRRSAGG